MRKDWKNNKLCFKDTPTNSKGKDYLNNAKCKICGNTIVVGKVKPSDKKDKV